MIVSFYVICKLYNFGYHIAFAILCGVIKMTATNLIYYYSPKCCPVWSAGLGWPNAVVTTDGRFNMLNAFQLSKNEVTNELVLL